MRDREEDRQQKEPDSDLARELGENRDVRQEPREKERIARPAQRQLDDDEARVALVGGRTRHQDAHELVQAGSPACEVQQHAERGNAGGRGKTRIEGGHARDQQQSCSGVRGSARRNAEPVRDGGKQEAEDEEWKQAEREQPGVRPRRRHAPLQAWKPATVSRAEVDEPPDDCRERLQGAAEEHDPVRRDERLKGPEIRAGWDHSERIGIPGFTRL